MSVHRRVGGGFVVGLVGLFMVGTRAIAAEHGGQEHGGQEHAGAATTPTSAPAKALTSTAQATPSVAQLRQRIASYVKERSTKTGTFEIKDPVTGTTRQLKFVRVHDRVGKTGNLYYSCTDMQDVKTGELLDLDFDVEAKEGKLAVVDERIHKVSGKARYTYDSQDHRIPLN